MSEPVKVDKPVLLCILPVECRPARTFTMGAVGLVGTVQVTDTGMVWIRPLEVERKATRPWLVTYNGTKIHESDHLWGLYEVVCKSDNPNQVAEAKRHLYEQAGSGGWDDICEYCPLHRYEHKGADHHFISEDQ